MPGFHLSEEGGFYSGLWTEDGNDWLLRSTGVTDDGDTVASTSVYTPIDSGMITWGYRSLIIGGEVRRDSETVTMVKMPPGPKQASN